MSNIDQTNQKLELLKMSRQLLNEEYINRRAEDHNKWLAECDTAWRTQRIKLPYPAFAPYPTEAEIVAKAVTLYAFINPSDTKDAPDLSQKEINIANQVKNMPEIPKVAESPWLMQLKEQAAEILAAEAAAAAAKTEPIAEPVPKATEPVVEPVPEIKIPDPVEIGKAAVAEIFVPTPNIEKPNISDEVKAIEPDPDPIQQPLTALASMKNLIPNYWRTKQ